MNEHKKGVKAVKYTLKTKNPVAKAHQTVGSGSGEHKDKKRSADQVRGQKHKNKELAELAVLAPIAGAVGRAVVGGIAKKAANAFADNETKENVDDAEYNDEAGMADNNLETLHRAVVGLDKIIDEGDNLPEWCQEKIAVAKSMLVTVWDYMQSEEDSLSEGNRPFRGVGGAFNRGDDERHDLDPTDWYFVKDGKMFAISVYPNQEQEARARGYSRTRDEAKAKASEQGMTENFGNYYNENIASKVFSQNPDLTSEDDVLNAAWEHVVRDMGRKKAGHLFNYDEDFPSDLVSSYFYLQKQKQGVAEEKVKGVDGKACWKGKRYAGKVKKADGTYKDKCVPMESNWYELRLQTMLNETLKK